MCKSKAIFSKKMLYAYLGLWPEELVVETLALDLTEPNLQQIIFVYTELHKLVILQYNNL